MRYEVNQVKSKEAATRGVDDAPAKGDLTLTLAFIMHAIKPVFALRLVSLDTHTLARPLVNSRAYSLIDKNV